MFVIFDKDFAALCSIMKSGTGEMPQRLPLLHCLFPTLIRVC